MVRQEQTQCLGEFARMGFTLGYPDDHIVTLIHEGEGIAYFSQAGATEQSIQAECANHMVIKHG